MWNLIELECPVDLVEYSPKDKISIGNLQGLITNLSNAADILTSDEPLWKEMEVLQNIQHRCKRILRCDKCLLYLHRIAHCLKKMVLLNLSKMYLDLGERFLKELPKTSENLFLPSCQQIEYVLLRTQAASKLVFEAITYTRDTFCFLLRKLKVGHTLSEVIVATSVTARLNVLLKAMLIQLCDMYRHLIPWTKKLKPSSFQWPDKLVLPEDLEDWLTKNFDSEVRKSCEVSSADASFLQNLMKNRNNKECDPDSVEPVPDNDDSSDCCIVSSMTDGDDYGEVIPRKDVFGDSNSNNKEDSNNNDAADTLQFQIIHAKNIESLQNIWERIRNSHLKLPKKLTVKNIRYIDGLLQRAEMVIRKKMLLKVPKRKMQSVMKLVSSTFAQRLGFPVKSIARCKKTKGSTTAQLKENEVIESHNSVRVEVKCDKKQIAGCKKGNSSTTFQLDENEVIIESNKSDKKQIANCKKRNSSTTPQFEENEVIIEPHKNVRVEVKCTKKQIAGCKKRNSSTTSQLDENEVIIELHKVNKKQIASCKKRNSSTTSPLEENEVIFVPHKNLRVEGKCDKKQIACRKKRNSSNTSQFEENEVIIETHKNSRVEVRSDKKQSASCKKRNSSTTAQLEENEVEVIEPLENLGDEVKCDKTCSQSSLNDKIFQPVKTLRKLKLQYEQLNKMLLSFGDKKKSEKLMKVYKIRITDIRLLKKSGDAKTARKMIFCTSKVFLTLCNSYLNS